MSASPRIYFHLGLPKTASTYLQHLVFPYLKGIQYFPKKYYKKFKECVAEHPEAARFLFSVEEDLHLRARMEQLAAHDPEIQVILVFRRHDSWLKSKYYYFIRKHGWATFDAFLMDRQHPNGFGGLEGFSYRRCIEWAEELFAHPPLVLIFEDLQAHPARFMVRLTQFTHTKLSDAAPLHRRLNTAFSPRQLYWLRRYNARVQYRPSSHPARAVRWVHYKAHQLGLHTVAQVAGYLPDAKVPLIDPQELSALRARYADDWAFCLRYAEKA
ncbi:MAG: hypothetical protein ACFCUI_09280 [Bernardetiaceae bacterium]